MPIRIIYKITLYVQPTNIIGQGRFSRRKLQAYNKSTFRTALAFGVADHLELVQDTDHKLIKDLRNNLLRASGSTHAYNISFHEKRQLHNVSLSTKSSSYTTSQVAVHGYR